MAYLAAVMAHPAFTARFKPDLVRPGLRVPLTADAKLFAEAVALGSRSDLAALLWRALRRSGGRPAEATRRACRRKARRPFPTAARFPARPSRCPTPWTTIAAKRRLMIGKGYVENVTPEMWAYEVSGKQVLRQWFSYRRRDRSRPIIGDRRPPSPLDNIQPDHWLPEYTSDLLDLLQRARPADRAGTRSRPICWIASARAGLRERRGTARAPAH